MNRQFSRYLRLRRSSASLSPHEILEKDDGDIRTHENWRKIVLSVCVVSLAFDPLFLFIPVIDSHRFCFTLDKMLGAVVCVLRTLIDTFHVIHIIVPHSQASLRGEIVVHSNVVRKTFFTIVDIASVLPIPQVLVLTVMMRNQWATSLVSKGILKWVILYQCIPRSIRIYRIFEEVRKFSGTVIQTKRMRAAFHFFLCVMPCHVTGAFWYFIAIETKVRCWRETCAKTPGCNITSFYCARARPDNIQFLNNSCPLIDPGQITNNLVFDFGMYIGVLKSGVVESRDYLRKFLYCYWWGLRNLSALGQNLETSNSIEEVAFALIVCVTGLCLFGVIIGIVQNYLQSIIMMRVYEMDEKKRATEKWMDYRKLPENLKERIKRYQDSIWLKRRGSEEEDFLRSLPKGLRLETKGHLYKDMLLGVPWINCIDDDDRLRDALCDRMKFVFYPENSYIVIRGDQVEEMLIVTKGYLESVDDSGGEAGYSNSCCIFRECDTCGDLLLWTVNHQNSPHLPTSNITLKTITDVEGFILLPDDLKFVVSHLDRFYKEELQHMIRYHHSEEQRLQEASLIQLMSMEDEIAKE